MAKESNEAARRGPVDDKAKKLGHKDKMSNKQSKLQRYKYEWWLAKSHDWTRKWSARHIAGTAKQNSKAKDPMANTLYQQRFRNVSEETQEVLLRKSRQWP